MPEHAEVACCAQSTYCCDKTCKSTGIQAPRSPAAIAKFGGLFANGEKTSQTCSRDSTRDESSIASRHAAAGDRICHAHDMLLPCKKARRYCVNRGKGTVGIIPHVVALRSVSARLSGGSQGNSSADFAKGRLCRVLHVEAEGCAQLRLVPLVASECDWTTLSCRLHRAGQDGGALSRLGAATQQGEMISDPSGSAMNFVCYVAA